MAKKRSSPAAIGQVNDSDKERLREAVRQGVYEKIMLGIRGVGGEEQKLTFVVEPILRPNGFILLRGRDESQTKAA